MRVNRYLLRLSAWVRFAPPTGRPADSAPQAAFCSRNALSGQIKLFSGRPVTAIARRESSEQSPAVGDGLGRRHQHHLSVGVWKAERQHLGQERSDLSRRKVDDGGYLAADKSIRAVVAGDLGGDFFRPISGPKSIRSFNAGFRACGKSSAETIVPTRISTLRKSSKAILGIVPVADVGLRIIDLFSFAGRGRRVKSSTTPPIKRGKPSASYSASKPTVSHSAIDGGDSENAKRPPC